MFLPTQRRGGALFGLNKDQAFFITCNRATMLPDEILNGRLICKIGIAPLRPAEFVIFRILQQTAQTQRRRKAMAHIDPNPQFSLPTDGRRRSGFSDVTICETTTNAVGYSEGNEPAHVRKLSGLTKLRKHHAQAGLTRSLELFNWHTAVVD